MPETAPQGFQFWVDFVLIDTISQKLNESNVFYFGGPLGNQIVAFRTR